MSAHRWLDVLSGKVQPDPTNAQEMEAALVRKVVLDIERKKQIEAINTDEKFKQFMAKIQEAV